VAKTDFPLDADGLSNSDHDSWQKWCLQALKAAERARSQHEKDWDRFYLAYRSWVSQDDGDWHSRVYMPIPFYIIETVLPKLIAQLPGFLVMPVGPEDVEGARSMEDLLKWAAEAPGSGCYEGTLYEELVKGFKQALKYGTGILKTYHNVLEMPVKRSRETYEDITVPTSNPMMDPETGEPFTDLDGNQMMEYGEESLGQLPSGYENTLEPETRYDGPAAESVDIYNFWPSPEATSIEDARYLIHRTFKTIPYVKKMVKQGIYKFPKGTSVEQFATTPDRPHRKRMSKLGFDSPSDPSQMVVEIHEFHYGQKLVTMLNQSKVVRVEETPFEHGEYPFVRIVDHYQEHEFWGIGEIEPIQHLVELMNTEVNARIDNWKLILNAMFAVNIDHVADQRELVMRPGGIIRMREPGMPINQVMQRIELGDVTSSAYEEVQQTKDMIEMVTGVSPYTAGGDSPSMNDTATGVSLISEQGNTRFALKMTLNELAGLKRLGRHFGSLLQQFLPEETQIRVIGEAGAVSFRDVTQQSILGAFDYDIDSQSTTQTESVRREQDMNLLMAMASLVDPTTGQPYLNIPEMMADILRNTNHKDTDRYLNQQQPPPAPAVPGAPPGALAPEMPPEGLPPQVPQGPPPGPPMGAPPMDPAMMQMMQQAPE
jgi:hypothetical protein